MWTLSSPNLPTAENLNPDRATPLFTLNPPDQTGGVPLSVLDLQANLKRPGVTGIEPIIEITSLPTANGNGSYTLSVPEDMVLESISQNGVVYVPAVDPATPLPGEFVRNSNGTVTLIPTGIVEPSLPVQLLGLKVGDELNEIPTDWVDSSLFSALAGLPVMGEITWSLSAEEQPTGSLKLEVTGDEIGSIEQRLKQGTELTIAGIGFYVANFRETLRNTIEFPGEVYDVEISLSGKWGNPKYNRPSRLRGGIYGETLDLAPFQDPDCKINNPLTPIARNRETTVSVMALARQQRVNFVGSSSPSVPSIVSQAMLTAGLSASGLTLQQQQRILAAAYLRAQTAQVGVAKSAAAAGSSRVSLGAWEIPVPPDTPKNAATEWESVARELLRQNGCFIDFNKPDAVRARGIDAVSQWSYPVVELEWSNQGNCEHSGDIFGYAVEHVATRVTGRFAEPTDDNNDEDTQGSPQAPPRIKWVRKPALRRSFISGDENLSSPPDEVQLIKGMGLNWWSSGRTKERIVTTSEYGTEVRRERYVYGLAYLSSDVVQTIGDETVINAPTAAFWRLVEYSVTDILIDEDTGYMMGSTTRGARYVPFKQESDQCEVYSLDQAIADSAGDNSAVAELLRQRRPYEPRWIPFEELERKRLEEFAAHYEDAKQESVPFEVEKICEPDGTARLRAVRDPNYVPPMFETATNSFKNNFAWMPNPDKPLDPDPESPPIPDLVTGQEQQVLKTVGIIKQEEDIFLSWEEMEAKRKGIKNELFVERVYEFSAQGSQLAEVTTRRTFSQNGGRPSEAQRRPAIYEKEQPEPPSGDPTPRRDPERKQQYEWIVCSPGFTENSPSTSSTSFPYADTFSEAMTGVQTDYKVEDIQSSVEFNYQIPFNAQVLPFDRIVVSTGRRSYATRVTGVSQSVTIQGFVDGQLWLTAKPTQIRAGIDRTVPLRSTRKALPLPPNTRDPNDPNSVLPPSNKFGRVLDNLGFEVVAPNRAKY